MHYEKFADGTVKCIEDEIPFEIPDSWEWTRLSTIATFSGGKTPSTSNRSYWGNDILWITSKDMKSKYIKSSLLKLSYEGAKQMELYNPKTLLLVVRSGILRHTIPAAIITEKATVNQDIKAISLYDPDWVEYLYICIKGMEPLLLSLYVKSGVTVENINFDKFQNTLFPIPPYGEMGRILEATKQAENHVETIEQSDCALKDDINCIKSRILDLAIRGKLVPQNPDDEPASVLLERIKAEKENLIKQGKIKRDKKESTIYKGDDNSYYEKIGNEVKCIDSELPFEIPENWTWTTLTTVCNINTGNSINETEKEQKYIGLIEGFNYIATKDINFDHSINYENGVKIPYNATKFQIANAGATLLCIEGGSAGRKIGKINQPVCYVNKLCAFESYGIDNDFLYYFLQTPSFLSTFKTKSSGLIGGVSISLIKQIYFSLPPIQEQIRIVTKINEYFSILENIEASLN